VSDEKKLSWRCPHCRKIEELDRHHANPAHRHNEKLFYLVRVRTEVKNAKEKS